MKHSEEESRACQPWMRRLNQLLPATALLIISVATLADVNGRPAYAQPRGSVPHAEAAPAIDPLFKQPYIDVDEWRDKPVRHRYNNSAIDTSQTAGAICVSVRLRPGEVVTVPFVLAWDFPEVAFAKNKTIWMRRYTTFYGARETAKNDYITNSYAFHQSAGIAKDAMLDHDNALKAVLNWWQPVVNESAYPTVLRTAALN